MRVFCRIVFVMSVVFDWKKTCSRKCTQRRAHARTHTHARTRTHSHSRTRAIDQSCVHWLPDLDHTNHTIIPPLTQPLFPWPQGSEVRQRVDRHGGSHQVDRLRHVQRRIEEGRENVDFLRDSKLHCTRNASRRRLRLLRRLLGPRRSHVRDVGRTVALRCRR